MANKIIIGLVCGNGKQWVEKWYEQAHRIGDDIIVIDNSTDGTGEYFLNKPKVAFYLKNKYNDRHMSRDYQRILDLARSIGATWIFNLDLDEFVSPTCTNYNFLELVNNTTGVGYASTYGFILFEMIDDDQHFMKTEYDCRLVHKFYKVLSHYKYDLTDKHGSSIPHNIETLGPCVNFKIQHFGHYTKELRDQKINMYTNGSKKDKEEIFSPYLTGEYTIQKWGGWDDELAK